VDVAREAVLPRSLRPSAQGSPVAMVVVAAFLFLFLILFFIVMFHH